jgi:hypothetical protein
LFRARVDLLSGHSTVFARRRSGPNGSAALLSGEDLLTGRFPAQPPPGPIQPWSIRARRRRWNGPKNSCPPNRRSSGRATIDRIGSRLVVAGTHLTGWRVASQSGGQLLR